MIIYHGDWTQADKAPNSVVQKRMCVQLNQSLDETSADTNLQRMKEMIAMHVRTTGFDVVQTLSLIDQDTSFASESGHNPYVPTVEQALAMQEQRGDGKKKNRRKKSGRSFIFKCFIIAKEIIVSENARKREMKR